MNTKTTFAIFAALAVFGLVSMMVVPILQPVHALPVLPGRVCSTPGEDHTDSINACYS